MTSKLPPMYLVNMPQGLKKGSNNQGNEDPSYEWAIQCGCIKTLSATKPLWEKSNRRGKVIANCCIKMGRSGQK
jgi:hypothetical protein